MLDQFKLESAVAEIGSHRPGAKQGPATIRDVEITDEKSELVVRVRSATFRIQGSVVLQDRSPQPATKRTTRPEKRRRPTDRDPEGRAAGDDTCVP